MAKAPTTKTVETLSHEEAKRKNISLLNTPRIYPYSLRFLPSLG